MKENKIKVKKKILFKLKVEEEKNEFENFNIFLEKKFHLINYRFKSHKNEFTKEEVFI